MDGGVTEAAGYRQGRNCIAGAHCQTCVSIMQIGGREEEPEKRASRSYILQEWQGG